MSDMWKRDSVYALRVLSGIVGEPRDGVMRSRRVRKEAISKSSSVLMSEVSIALLQSAMVIPLLIVTIADQIERVASSFKFSPVTTGRMALRMARLDVVACRQGVILLTVIGKEYLSTIGLPRATKHEDNDPVVYMPRSDE